MLITGVWLSWDTYKALSGEQEEGSIFSSWEMEVGETRVEEKSLVVVVTTRKESSGICCNFQE